MTLLMAKPLDTSDELLMSDDERRAFMTPPKRPFWGNTPTNRSGYRGVTRSGNRFVARVNWQNVNHYLGTFPTAIDAAHAYDAKARELQGALAFLNFADFDWDEQIGSAA